MQQTPSSFKPDSDAPAPAPPATADAMHGVPEAHPPLDQQPFSVRLSLTRNRLTAAELRVAEYFTAHPESAYMSITEVASASGCSYGSVVRFCQKLGCAGFQEFKVLLAAELGDRRRQQASSGDYVVDAVETARRELADTQQVIDRGALEQAGLRIAQARRVLIGAVGSSTSVAVSLTWKLSRIGIAAHALSDAFSLSVQASFLRSEDVFIAVSASGATKDILKAAELARSERATVIALTNYSNSPLVDLASLVLCSASERDPIAAEIPSTVARELLAHLLFEQVRQHAAVSDERIARTQTAVSDRFL